MFFTPSILLALSAALTGVLAQNYTGSSNCSTGPTYADQAAAWGSAGALPPIDENGVLSDNRSAYYSWLYSVQRNGRFNVSLAVPAGSPRPEADSYWSICYVALSLPTNVVERAQSDNGSCRTALDNACVDGLIATARGNATFGGATPHQVCTNVLSAVGDYTKQNASCSKFFGNGTTNLASEINSLNGASSHEPICPLVSTTIRPGATLIGSGWVEDRPLQQIFANSGADARYFENSRNVKAILSVYIRNRNASTTVYVNETISPFADMNCVRVTNYSSNAQQAPALPDPTPVNAAGGLLAPQGSVMVGAVVMAVVTSFTLAASALW